MNTEYGLLCTFDVWYVLLEGLKVFLKTEHIWYNFCVQRFIDTWRTRGKSKTQRLW